MKIDLHTHSTHSDGTLSPSELLNLAKKNNIDILAITDHDDIEGSKKLVESNPKEITIYSGVELNAKVKKGQMHILGYNIDLYNDHLNKRLKELKENSKKNIMLYIKQLENDFNIVLPEKDIQELLNREGNIGRPQLALILIKYGYCQTVKEAFDKYLKDDKVRKIKLWIEKEECIDLITNAGGIPILAHPFTLKLTDEELYKEIEYLVNIGLKGIEIIHSNSNEKEREFYKKIANDFNLITTGGTDYHGKEVKPNIELGSGINNNVQVDETIINILDKVDTRYK